MAETGHIKNVEHFQMMIAAVQGYGGVYKPANADITLANLQTDLANANAGIDAVTTALIPWKVAVNERESEYEGIGKLTTRVAASFASCGAEKNAVEDMKSFARKIAGDRKSKIKADDPNTPEDESKHNSVSQRSYTQIAEHLDNIIEMCQNEPKYTPNEAELQVGSLQTKSAACKTKNQGVIDKTIPVDNWPHSTQHRALRRQHRHRRACETCKAVCQITFRCEFAAIQADQRLAIHEAKITKPCRFLPKAELLRSIEKLGFSLKSSICRAAEKTRNPKARMRNREAQTHNRTSNPRKRIYNANNSGED